VLEHKGDSLFLKEELCFQRVLSGEFSNLVTAKF